MKSWFDESPEVYERARPSYPPALWDALFAVLPSAPRILEIGAGTGKATHALLSRGAAVLACEPGPNLARFMTQKFAPEIRKRKLEVRAEFFEDMDIDAQSFDAVVAATCWHWLDPGSCLQKAATALKRNGALAVVDTMQVDDAIDRGFFAASHPIYQRYFAEPDRTAQLPGRNLTPAVFDALNASDTFGQSTLARFNWDQGYATAQYIDLVRSYSNTAMLVPTVREHFLQDLATFIDTEFAGFVLRPLVITLVVARLPRV